MLSNKYRFIQKEMETLRHKKSSVVICIQDLDSGIAYPHPLTHFLTHNNSHNLNSINSQRTVGAHICRFLNYLYKNVIQDSTTPLALNGTKGITLEHGMDYLKTLQLRGVSKSYYLSIKFYLNKFYYYLCDEGLLNEKLTNQLVSNNLYTPDKNIFDRNNLKSIRSTNNHRKIKIKDFGDNRYKLISMFIEISKEVAPDITFGICLQIFGGLRKGEVLNVMRENIILTNDELSIRVSDNRAILFPDKSNTKDESPKRVNYLEGNLLVQKILSIPMVLEIYHNHIKQLNTSTKPKLNDAVFMNKNMLPMTGQVYESRFLKVKKKFLERLLENRMYSDYHLLTQGSWSTHIGRGLFSNILFDMDLSVTQIAILRGDRSINAFQSYFDEMSSQQAVKKHLPKLVEYLKNTTKESNLNG